jgi:thioredoxin reductase (NADPH)
MFFIDYFAAQVKHNWDTMKDNIQNYIGSLNFNYRVQLRDKKVEYLNAQGKFLNRNRLHVSIFCVN